MNIKDYSCGASINAQKAIKSIKNKTTEEVISILNNLNNVKVSRTAYKRYLGTIFIRYRYLDITFLINLNNKDIIITSNN